MKILSNHYLILALVLAFKMFAISSCTSKDNANQIVIDSSTSHLISVDDYSSGRIKIKIPPGNLNPEINWTTLYQHLPLTTKKEFQKFANDPIGLKHSLEARYRKTIQSLAKDPDTLAEMHSAARTFQIDPILILGNVVGEHTYNVGLVDSVQNLLILSASWGAKWALRFKSNGTSLVDLIKLPQFEPCQKKLATSHAEYWDCVVWIWETKFRGKNVNGVTYQNNGFRLAFFNPVGLGITYGLGQMDPIRALMVTDRVHYKTGLPLLSIERPEDIYTSIINPRVVVYYIAANIELAIQTYYSIAHMDISGNPGVVASLYNLGKEKFYAKKRFEENVQRLRQGLSIEPARESYYGFFVNEKASELRRLLLMNDTELKQVARTGIIPN